MPQNRCAVFVPKLQKLPTSISIFRGISSGYYNRERSSTLDVVHIVATLMVCLEAFSGSTGELDGGQAGDGQELILLDRAQLALKEKRFQKILANLHNYTNTLNSMLTTASGAQFASTNAKLEQ